MTLVPWRVVGAKWFPSQHQGNTQGTKGKTVHDPIDQLATCGLRVVWADDLDRQVILLREERIVLADSSVSRSDVSELALSLWWAQPQRHAV